VTLAGQIVFWCFVASPLIAIAVAAIPLLRDASINKRLASTLLSLVLTVFSAFTVFGFADKRLVGSDYSTRRYATIYASIGVSIVLGVYCSRLPNATKKPLVVSAALLAAVWLFHAAISSVV
jgi:hypothetical protein